MHRPDFRHAARVSRIPTPSASAGSSADWVTVLRQSDVPERMIAVFAAADFQSRWEARSRENQKRFVRGEIEQEEIARLDLEHDSELEKAMRTALGDEGFQRWDEERILIDLDGAEVRLTADENKELYQLRKAMNQKRVEMDAECSPQVYALSAQYEEQVRKLLGDERYVQLQSGGDTGLGTLRRTLRGMKVDDNQMAEMEAAQQQWNNRRSRLEIQVQKEELSGEDYEKQLRTLEAERDQEYQKTLGAEGFAEFQKSQDECYRTIKRLGPSWGFSDEEVGNLYTAIQDYESTIKDYRSRAQTIQGQGQQVDWPEVEKALKDFSNRTEEILRVKLGDKFDELKRHNVLPFDR